MHAIGAAQSSTSPCSAKDCSGSCCARRCCSRRARPATRPPRPTICPPRRCRATPPTRSTRRADGFRRESRVARPRPARLARREARFARARARRPRARTIRACASWCRTSVVVCGSSDANRARRIESNQKKRVTFLELLCVLRFARDATVSRRARGVVARVRACAARASERTLTSLRRGHANLLCIFFPFIRCHIRR